MECCIRCSLRGAFHLVVLPVPDPRLTGTPAHFSCKDAALPGSAAGTQMWRSAGNCVLAPVAVFEACTQAIHIPSGSHGESCIVTGSIPRRRGTGNLACCVLLRCNTWTDTGSLTFEHTAVHAVQPASPWAHASLTRVHGNVHAWCADTIHGTLACRGTRRSGMH